jgi:aminoglycoside phosphotransferase (APT) family kinase protein
MKDISSPPIAQGRTAELYAWDDGYVLKLFRDWCPADWVDYEARIARAVHASGVPSPAAGDVLEVNGRRGLVYERLEGISMLQEMNTHPWTLLKHARSLAELQVQINKQSISGLPSCKDRLEHDIRSTPHLDDSVRNQVLALLHALPDGQNLCHGDFHPGNILLTKRGPVVIDWMTAYSGSPWADVARTHLLLNIGAKADRQQVNPLIKTVVGLYFRAYQRRHNALSPDPEKQVERWLPVMAAARLYENIIPERAALLQMVQEGM